MRSMIPIDRRTFTQTALATTAVLANRASTAGAAESVRLGFIGLGNRGCQLLKGFLEHPDAKVVALCDVYEPYLNAAYDRVDPRWKPLAGRIPKMPAVPEGVERVADFRRVIDRPDVDAVVVAAPDHWHAIMAIAACRAGKDVYCEKPLSITIHEGRAMVNAAREHERIVQVGTHRRASRMYAKLAELVQGGALGQVVGARIGYASNMAPVGIGRAPDSPPPPGLDWDLWLGPRAERPFNPNVLPYKFRWHHLYSSQVANWGTHYFDLVRWLTGEIAPTAVAAMGSRAGVDDDRTIPVSSESIFEHASGMLTQFSLYESNGQGLLPDGAEVELRGTLGTLRANIRGYKIIPEKGGQFQDPKLRREPESGPGDLFDLDVQAARDFLDNVKSRKRPVADVEEGHRSTIYAHLANIAMIVRERLTWDSTAERFTGAGADAANALLHYEYRKPWTL